MYILRDAPGSNEILEEIKNTKNKWKIEIGNEEYMKIEKDLDKEIEAARKFLKSETPNFNKNDEGKIMEIQVKKQDEENNSFVSNTNPINKNEKIQIQENLSINKSVSSEKKGYKKIKIVEEDTPEENENENQSENKNQEKSEAGKEKEKDSTNDKEDIIDEKLSKIRN